MKKGLKLILAALFFASEDPRHLNAREGSNLELHYLIFYDDAWNDLSEKTIKSGNEITLQMKYTRKGFPKKSKTRLKIEIFDAQGNIVLQDQEMRPQMEGTRRDRYAFTIPKGSSGHYLISTTLQVFQKRHVLAKISRTIPFDVVK
ncbi:MAG: hypothetical protein HYS07_09005 [Chlamydiae bacterium]|nr:hypothetical protein [Chlamydiota bacterium]MBI3276984.1 hypothetical protein [Chlamydiota bacterium]